MTLHRQDRAGQGVSLPGGGLAEGALHGRDDVGRRQQRLQHLAAEDPHHADLRLIIRFTVASRTTSPR